MTPSASVPPSASADCSLPSFFLTSLRYAQSGIARALSSYLRLPLRRYCLRTCLWPARHRFASPCMEGGWAFFFHFVLQQVITKLRVERPHSTFPKLFVLYGKERPKIAVPRPLDFPILFCVCVVARIEFTQSAARTDARTDADEAVDLTCIDWNFLRSCLSTGGTDPTVYERVGSQRDGADFVTL